MLPYETSEYFAKKMKKKKNVAELLLFEGQGHGFFNLNVSFDLYQSTLMSIDDFLVVNAFLEADPDARLDAM